jgi:DNA modification methylase/transcriptional regulator with XRE-family HTH domain
LKPALKALESECRRIDCTEVVMSFGTVLRQLRMERHMSLRSLSARLKVDHAYLSRLEKGRVSPSEKVIQQLSRVFRISREELRLSAGKLPEDITRIFYKYPVEAASFLREQFGAYGAVADVDRSRSGGNGLPDGIGAVFQRDEGQLYQGDCLDLLQKLPSDSVDLIITSPPYADNRRRTYTGVLPERYVDWFLPRADAMRRVLKSTGSFILNIKERVVDGERHPYVLQLILKMREQGWKWIEEYLWCKKNCYPGYWPNRFRDTWERCLHFTKQKQFRMFQRAVMVPMGDWRISRLKNLSSTDKTRDDSRVMSGFGKRIANWVDREMAYPTNVLHMATECGNKGHSATFPVALPAWFIRLFTEPGDVVLDPFMGSGSAAVACLQTQRRFIGIEINPDYIKLAGERIKVEKARFLMGGVIRIPQRAGITANGPDRPFGKS